MKLLSLFLIGLNAFFYCSGQSDEKFIIDMKTKEAETKISLPFHVIKILDSRYDQSNIGSIVKKLSFNGITKGKAEAVFPDSLKVYLPVVLSRIVQLKDSSSDTLAILVKRFRLVDYVVRTGPDEYEPQLLLNIAASFYVLNNNLYRKIFSIENIFDQPFDKSKYINKKNIADLRIEALIQLLSGVLSKKKWQASAASFSHLEVEDGLRQRFDLPVLTDNISPVGLYKNFSEFKNNKPSVTGVKLIYKQRHLVDVKDSNNKKIDLLKYWGLGDGQKKYIIFRSNLYELHKRDRSFRFQSYRKKEDGKGSPGYVEYATEYGLLPSAFLKAEQEVHIPEYFYLNMDTGEVHLEEIFGKSSFGAFHKETLK